MRPLPLLAAALCLLWWRTVFTNPVLGVPLRTGNLLFQHAHARLRAALEGRLFADLNLLHSAAPFPLPPLAWESAEGRFEYGANENYMFDFATYRHHRAQLRRWFPAQARPSFDVVVHVRLDDVFGPNEDYTLLPPEYYRQALAAALQLRILRSVAALARNLTGAPTLVYSAGSAARHLAILGSGRALVASVGTFWFWPAYLSAATRRVHVPDWGVNRLYHLCVAVPTLRGADGSRSCVYESGFAATLHPVALTRKLSRQHAQRLFAP